MSRRVLVSLLALILVTQLAGCSAMLNSPMSNARRVTVRNFEVTAVSLSAIEGVIGLDIDNPNNVNLSANGLTYAMSISDKEVLTGQKQERIIVPSLGTKTIELPVRISYLVLLEVIPEVLATGVADYTVTGSIKANVFQDIPFTRSGKFKIPLGNAQ